MRATRAAFLLLPLAGVLAVDPVAFDFHAIKFLAIGLVAAATLGAACAAGLFALTSLSLPLWLFAGVRGIELLRAPPGADPSADPSGRALRWYALLLGLTLAHHVIAAAAPRKWLARRLVPLLAGLGGVIAIYTLVQALSDARQAHAFFANRNFAGAGLAMLLPYALSWRTKARVPLVALLFIGLAATQSRGGMLAAACVIAWWASRRLLPFRWLILGGLPAIVLALGIAFGPTNTIRVRAFWYEGAIRIGAALRF